MDANVRAAYVWNSSRWSGFFLTSTRYKVWHGDKPIVAHIRVLGWNVGIVYKKKHLTDLVAKAILMRLLDTILSLQTFGNQ